MGNSSENSVKLSSQQAVNVYNAVTGEVLYTSAAGEELIIKGEASAFLCDGKFYAGSASKISVQTQNGATIFCDGMFSLSQSETLKHKKAKWTFLVEIYIFLLYP